MNDLPNEFLPIAGKNGFYLESKKIRLSEAHDNELVIYQVRAMAVKAGFQQTDEFMVATASSELATNILRYAGKGEIVVSIIKDAERGIAGIELDAKDTGPGIGDVEQAMREQYSSLSNSLGLGLPSIRNIMDEFYIESVPGRGTRVLTRKWKKDEPY